jgi:uncharacterized membrane protein (DUF106 family)
VDFAIVATIVVFVVMVVFVHHVYLEKMPKKSMAVVVLGHVLYGPYYCHVVYVV